MKQIMQVYNTGDLSVKEVPSPTMQPGQVLVQTGFSAISVGTEGNKVRTAQKSLIGKAKSRPDLVKQVISTFKQEGLKNTYLKVKNRLEEPSSLGYSSSGTVIGVGEGVTEFSIGDRVACGSDAAAHAEFISVPVNLCAKVPNNVKLKHAAFTTIGSIALQGVRQSNLNLGDIVVVIGLGLLGQILVQILKANGCNVIGIDLDERKTNLASEMGADLCFNRNDPNLEQGIFSYSKGFGVDTVIIAAATKSNDPIQLASELCRDRGTIISIGHVNLNLPPNLFYDKELVFKNSRSYGPGRYDPYYEAKGIDYPIGYVRWTEKRNMEAFLGLLATNGVNLEPIITHRFNFSDAEIAYKNILSLETDELVLGVLFKYDGLSQGITESQIVFLQEKLKNNKKTHLGVGFVGAGSFAKKFLIPQLQNHPKIDLIGISTLRGISSRASADKFGFNYCTSDNDMIINDPDIDCVFIATHHNSHSVLVTKALEQNKTVFVEKPLALSWGQLEDVKTSLEKQNGYLFVGFNRRFAPMTQQIIEFYNNRTEPMMIHYRVNAGFLEYSHWYHDPDVGGGRLLGEVCHFIDWIAFVSKSPLKEIYCVKMDNNEVYHDDNLNIILKMEDGTTGSIMYNANGESKLPKERIECFCQGGVAIIDDFSKLTMIKNGKKKEKKASQDKGHSLEIDRFIDYVTNNGLPPASVESFIRSTEATLAAYDSLLQRLPVIFDNSEWGTRLEKEN